MLRLEINCQYKKNISFEFNLTKRQLFIHFYTLIKPCSF